MDLAGKFTLSASMLLTGFSIVFGVLLLLIIMISIYGKIVSGAQSKASVRKSSKAKEITKAKVKAEKEEPKAIAQAPEAASDEGIPEEIAAVISAAVYSMYGSTQKVKIKSVKRSRPRSAWANAGVARNIKPF